MASLGLATPAPRRRATLKPSKQTCAILGAASGLMLAASVGLFVWQNGELATIETSIAQKEDLATQGERTAHQLQTVQSEFALTETKLRYLETSVTASQFIPTLLKQVEDLARSTNLEVSMLRHSPEAAPAPPVDKEARKSFRPWPYDKEHIELDVRGNYWDVSRFIFRLNAFPKVLAVESVNQQPQGSLKGISPRLQVKIKMTGFVFKGDGLPGGPAPKVDGQKGGSASQVRAEERQVMDAQTPGKP